MGKKSDFSIAVILLVVMIPLFFFMVKNMDWTIGQDHEWNQGREEDQQKDQDKNGGSEENKEDQTDGKDKDKGEDKNKADENQNKEKIIWGVDSASRTTEELYVCVNEQFGEPKIWGRYLGSKEDVSQGMSKEEVNYLHEQGTKILPIYNHFSKAEGYDHGIELAEHAISLAQEIGLPKEKVIFADIEPDYPVDAKFIQGWYDGIKKSPYHPGIYGIFAEEQPLFEVYEQAVKDKKELGEQMIIWSAHPQLEVTAKEKAPEYQPNGPKGSLILGWQYGIDAKECNIDTNLFKDEIMKYLW
ncbi:DUF1906 domain-containing protein [Lederbergia sp. NSJ-179]|uniref:glycoside hydrolase domain-containing protein n=1 Tax=Lederbergia sp. NSJ-179 TaxID=2931402 RepID=UPI001FD59B5C|nr:glycoside hydrolase domain-containing protein [Lederbergia sp. NSJ-179]MCJ7842652.1 DUF1906 domain-containing protein [Lederbergia sp. NSJ-179]